MNGRLMCRSPALKAARHFPQQRLESRVGTHGAADNEETLHARALVRHLGTHYYRHGVRSHYTTTPGILSPYLNSVVSGLAQIISPCNSAVGWLCALPGPKRTCINASRLTNLGMVWMGYPLLHWGPAVIFYVVLIAPVYATAVDICAVYIVIGYIRHPDFYPQIRAGPRRRVIAADCDCKVCLSGS